MTDLTRQLQGREIAELRANGTTLLIKTKCGTDVTVKWVDQNGVAIKGQPIIASKGFRLDCRRFGELVYGPLASGIRR